MRWCGVHCGSPSGWHWPHHVQQKRTCPDVLHPRVVISSRGRLIDRESPASSFMAARPWADGEHYLEVPRMSYHAAQQSDKELDFVWNESSCRGGPLHRAVLHNSLTKVKELVESSRAPSNTVRSVFTFEDHETGEEGRAEAVHIAASRGHLDIMKYLLDKKADPSAKVVVSGRPKYDVLHAAVHGEGRGGRVDMVDFLYTVASPTTDSEGRSLIHIAFLTGSREIIEYLRSRNSDLKHMHSFRQTPREQMDTGVHQPLSFGILGGQMSEDLLSEMAQPTAGSLKIFIEECPQCIPAFLDRITSEEENITATEIARHLTAIDIAKVLRESPEAALALLRGCTTEPECGNSGWHALPTRVSFADRDWMQMIRTLFNPVRHMLTFYVDEVTWKFDSNRFEHPEWHKYITNRDFGRPVLDAEIQVCHVQDILCAEVFGAMCTEENVESEVMVDDNLIRAMVRHVFWNGCCRVDLTTVLLNFWGLGLLIAEEALMYDADLAAEVMPPTTRMGKGRRLFNHGHGTVGAQGSTSRGTLFLGVNPRKFSPYIGISNLGFLEASTFYFYPRSGYHLLALLEDGLASPLLAQLVDGIRSALPRYAAQPLSSVRAWKADNSALQRLAEEKPELQPQGKLNLLLWLVPASALNGSVAGALHLLPRNATGDAAPTARVAYAANRAVLWRDELEAQWVGPGWKSGFLQRGIHLLFTFGWSDECAAAEVQNRPGRPPAERSDRTAQSFDERYRSASFVEEDPRRAKSGLVLPSNAVASLQVGKAGKVTPSKAAPLLPKRLQNVSDASDANEDSASNKTPSTKRVMDIPELVRQFEDLLHDFRQDAEEHMFNVIGPNPWNLGFIQTGPLQKRAINLLKAFTRSVQLQFPKAYSLDEAMKPPTVRRFMRTCKLCLEDVGQWTQICLIHVSAFCKHEKLEQDIQHILSQGGNINARAMFEVCLQYQNRDETTSVSCSVQPIHLAVHAGNLRGVEVLLRQKAAVESRSTFDAVPDFTPLHLATALWARAGEDSLKQHEVVKLLLAQLADPNAVDLSGTSCNRLRPAASASRPQGHSGLRKGMYVTLNTEKANQLPRLRRDAKEFLQTADFSRQSEFIVVADVEDPENEHELVSLQLPYCYTDLKIQQSCVDVLGWRFFSDCCLALKDELGEPSGAGTGGGAGVAAGNGSAELSPKFSKSYTATTWQEEDASGTSSIQLEDLRRVRAVTIQEGGDAPVLSEEEDEESFPHDVPWEDAIHMKLANPLRDGRFFRKRNRVVSGYLLHFAVDEMVFSESEVDRDVVRTIVQLRADVHSRAWVKRNISKDFFDVTAIHMAAASFSLPAVKTLLEVKASIESAATFDEIPCWTPLAEALLATIHHSKEEDVQSNKRQKASKPKSVLQIKTKECVIQYLLKERANPDGCGGSGGLSCLHLAVGKNCQSEIVHMLVEGNADVTLKTSGYVRATRAHGNRGWDRGLTPLQICDYADQVYPQQARSEVMALLAPSLRGASFLLQDVTSMSAFSLSAADELVRRVVEEAEAKKEGSAARALNTLRLRAITGSKSPEGFTPLDSIAELIEIAPTTAINMLDGLLLTEPDTEDPHVHPLPHRANMNYKHRAQGIGWSATIFDLPNLSVQTTYQPDCNIDRNSHFDNEKEDKIHQEWPCWLRQQKVWHGVLAPKASCTRASLVGPAGFEKSFADQMGSSSTARLKYQQGDRDVCIKVLLVANILDVRILQALTNVGWSEIFAEKVVQAILIQETILFAAFLSWSFGCFSWQPKKTPWAVIFAIFVNESITMAWWMRGHFSHNWTLKQFFLHPMTSFRLFQLYLLWWLLWRTFFGYDLDHTWRNDEDLGDNKRTFPIFPRLSPAASAAPPAMAVESGFHFASEVVTEGNLDKLCDRVCETILEALLSQDVESRAQLDACAKLGMVMLLGEVVSKATVPYEQIIREAVRAAGYDHEDMGMDWRTVNIIVALEDRSAEWHRALLGGADPSRSLGDDQAVLCGYATDETMELRPLSQQLADQLAAQMDVSRKDGSLSWLRPDARVQVTVKYELDSNRGLRPQGVSSIAIVYGHSADVKPSEAEQDLLEKVVKVVLPSESVTGVTFTPRSSRESAHGASSASGASGRRTLESYGGWAPGYAFSGRDGGSLARCGAVAAAWAAKSLVAGKFCRRCRVQLRYVAGEAQIQVDSYGSAKSDAQLEELLLRHFDFRPQALQKELQLNASMKAKEKPWEKPKVLQ
eukprot:s639_g2.t2